MALASQHLLSNLQITQYDFDPDGTSATDIGWVDMRDYTHIAIAFFRTVGTSDLTFLIHANAASDGSGTDVVVKTVTLAAQPNAVGDFVVAEVSVDEIAQEAADAGVSHARYVSAVLTFATGTDEGVLTYIRKAGRAALDLTADVVA